MPNPDSDRAVKHLPAVVNLAITDLVGAALLGSTVANLRFANFQAAAAEVGEFAADDAVG